MPKINKVQYIERWDALPSVLREAMFSPANGELIWKIGEEHHLKEEQIAQIAGICGNIVMGFIHLEDLAKEIKTDTGIDERLASAIAREIDRKVFSPLRSEIEKVYSPAGPVMEEIIKPEEIKEEIREEIEKPVETPVAEEIKGEEITGEHKIDISEFKVVKPSEEEPPVPPGLAEKPAEIKLSEASRQPEEVELPKEVQLPEIKEAEGPIIIHEEAEIKTVKEAPRSFSLGSVFGFFTKKETKTVEPPTTAEIEMEMSEEPARVVDYKYKESASPPTEVLENEETKKEETGAVEKEIPAPGNLPVEEIQHKEVQPPEISRQYGEVEPPKVEEKPAEEKGDDVIDLSSFK